MPSISKKMPIKTITKTIIIPAAHPTPSRRTVDTIEKRAANTNVITAIPKLHRIEYRISSFIMKCITPDFYVKTIYNEMEWSYIE
ncbi:hypothetical protein APP_24420 [Aeribacillus pallidus]|nr:hypothetical protein APP_24420 [Aeribacillus pallidus]